MNCWIILLLLCCSGKNNGISIGDNGCGCDCHDNCHNSCIQPRMWEKDAYNVRRERNCDCDDHNHTHSDGCGCSDEERVRGKWMPYSECNDRNECDCK